jgi:tetratricopeptide (TPR) repeat protein
MLTTDLSRSAELDVIATQRLYDLLAAAGRDPEEALDRATASELARWAGADIVISGAVFRSGNRYRIDAQAFDTTSGTVTVARKAEGEDLFAMVDELTSGLRQGLRVGSEKSGALQRVTTSSEEAFRDYTRGRQLHDRLEFDQAAAEFKSSLEADPGFALARVRLAMTLLSQGRPEEAVPLVEQAASEMDRMPEAERMLTGALQAYLVDGEFETVVSRLEAMAAKYPEDKDAIVLWARALSDLAGRPGRATHKLREALARDPGNLGAIAVLVDQLVALGADDVAREMLGDAVRSNPQAAEPLSKLLASLDEG